MKNTDTVKQVVADVFETDAGGLNAETVIRELESWDSMLHMVLVTQLEKTLDLQFTGKEIADMKSIGDIDAILSQRQNVAP